MQTINQAVTKQQRPITVAQFGEGNFLRAFVDWMLDLANEKGVTNHGVVLIKPIAHGDLTSFQAQDCLYTVLLRGKQDGVTVDSHRTVTSVMDAVDTLAQYDDYMTLARLDTLRFVVSNTTEAGIVYDQTDRLELCPPTTYPGKLTKFLLERYTAFGGDPAKGLIILPVELIEHNGAKLRDCVKKLSALWGLPGAFQAWVDDACIFCDTLVDRIVTGYPREDEAALWQTLGYEDRLMVAGEPFALWVIQSDKPDVVRAALPLEQAGLPVVITDNLRPYRERKVRLLNGAHTGSILGAYLAGLDTVGQCMADPVVRPFMEKMVYGEIAPTVELDPADVRAFADSVMERFENPFIRHLLLSIALNSTSKWKSRILPSLLDSHAATGKLPPLLTFSFAALLAFYRTSQRSDKGLVGHRSDGTAYEILDDAPALDFFAANAALPDDRFVALAAANTGLWGQDLSQLPGFCAAVTEHLGRIGSLGALAAMREATAQ